MTTKTGQCYDAAIADNTYMDDTNDNEEIQFNDDNRITTVTKVIDDDKDFDDNTCNETHNIRMNDNMIHDRRQ